MIYRHRNLPSIVIGDFNSHRTTWDYTTTDNNGEAVEYRAEANYIPLIHDVKLSISFNSKRWKSGYNPDLIFASTSIGGITHRPICVSAYPVVMAQLAIFRRFFNLMKANWKSYAAEADTHIEKTESTPEFII